MDWPTPDAPSFSEERILGHLRFLNGQDVGLGTADGPGRETGAAYVAAQMRGLQPPLAGSHRIRVEGGLAVGGASVFGGAEEGTGFVVDARSDSGAVLIRSVAHCPGVPEDGFGPVDAVLLPSARWADGAPEALAHRGTRALVLVGALEAEQEARTARGLLVVRLTSAGAEELFGVGAAPASCESWRLATPVPLRVRAPGAHERPVMSVLGLLAGKDPGLAEELVLICTEIDAQGSMGEGTAALIELAQRYRSFMTTELFPRRSLMFGVFYGYEERHAALRHYLDQPLWPLAATRAVLYIGADPAHEAEVRRTLEARGLKAYLIESGPAVPAGDGSAAALRAGAGEGLRLARAAHAELSRLAGASSGDRP